MGSLAMYSCGPNHDKTNVIIIFMDDQGYQDVGVFGSPDILTPNLDKMASEGAILTSFYAAQPVCSASRAALLTGCYPNRIGIQGALGPNARVGLNPNETTLAEVLKANGYATAIYGKWHLGDAPEMMPVHHGFDDYFGIPYSNDMWPYHPWQGTVFNFPPLPLIEDDVVIDTLEEQSQLTTQITERSVQFINDHAKEPFFLYVPHPQPHVPLFVSDKFKGKSERGLYGDVIMEIDWSVGEILKAVEDNGLSDNTLIIFTSDNGPWLSYGEHAGSALPLREGKGTTWEGGVREPFIIKLPNKIKPGSVVSTPVMAIDLLPTIANLTQSALPTNAIDGKDVWPIISGASDESPHEAYYFYYANNELQALRSGRWKMYLPHHYASLSGRPGGKGGIPEPYDIISMDSVELYDLENDISEIHNVAAENEEVVEELMKLYIEMRSDLGDRLSDEAGTGHREPWKRNQ